MVTPLHIPLFLFLGAHVMSTILSIDPHTSVWGYYSRSNGGLMSYLSYLLLFCAFVSTMDKQKTIALIKTAILSGVFVSLWAIPEHFGVSPSCVILRGELNADCWVQDVQARVFASLGQPNWLAAYLGMLIFPALYFFLTATTLMSRITYYLLLIIYYMAFTFTYSRGGTTGLLAGSLLFLLLPIIAQFKPTIHSVLRHLSLFSATVLFAAIWGYFQDLQHNDWTAFLYRIAFFVVIFFLLGLVLPHIRQIFKLIITSSYKKSILLVIISFAFINILYGSALTRFQLSNLVSDSQSEVAETKPTTLTQLENGGTESGKIRLIVWKGAIDVFRYYPWFGSGVETFAYAYYQFRPVEHNLVSEWDFLYNKAHNEFLNYLATTGILGFGSYGIIIITFITFIFKKLKVNSLLLSALFASYVIYLVQNVFGFSVVIIAVFFYLFPAMAFVITDSLKPFIIPKSLLLKPLSLINSIYQRPAYTQAAKITVFVVTAYCAFVVLQLWYADTLFTIGERSNEKGNPGRAYNYLSDALMLNKNEPFYQSELGYAAASAALALEQEDATLSAELAKTAIQATEAALNISPVNVSFWRTAIRTYYQLALLDESFNQKTLEVIDHAIQLAPTDPKLYYNKAIILGQLDRNEEAITTLEQAIHLKQNYREAYFGLSLFLFDQKQHQKAVENMHKVLQLVPNDPDVLKQLNEWGKEGIATNSAND